MSFATRIFRIFVFFTLGFFLTAIYRTINAALAPGIRLELGISNKALAWATAAYFLTFSIMQIPVGILLDFFGPRRVQAALFTVAAAGSLIFAIAEGEMLLIIGRLVIGFGMAGGLIAGFVANRLWFNRSEVPMLNSFLSSFGSLGTIIASVPAYYAMETIGWRWISVILAGATLLLAIHILVFVPDPDPSTHHRRLSEQLRGVRQVLCDSYFWRVAPALIFFMGFFMNLQSFWITPYLMTVNEVSPATVSYFLLAVAIGTVLGLPSAAIIERLLKPVGISIDQVVATGLFLSLIFQAFINSNRLAPSFGFWFLYAFFANFSITSYASVLQHFHSTLAGRATTTLNTLLFSGLFLFQFIFGLIVNIWENNKATGYCVAFWIFFALQILCFLWFLFGKGKMNEQE